MSTSTTEISFEELTTLIQDRFMEIYKFRKLLEGDKPESPQELLHIFKSTEWDFNTYVLVSEACREAKNLYSEWLENCTDLNSSQKNLIKKIYDKIINTFEAANENLMMDIPAEAVNDIMSLDQFCSEIETEVVEAGLIA
jgi:hypothetical protein